MVFFAFYAGLVWYGALKWRREILGFVSTLLGVLGIAAIGYVHYLLNAWSNGAMCLPLLQSMLYPFGVLILVMGVFLSCLPRKYAGPMCRGCGYDLRGLETDERRCPECATRHVLYHGIAEPCRVCGLGLRARGLAEASCGRCGTVYLLLGRSPGGEADFDRPDAPANQTEPVVRRPMSERLGAWLAARPAVQAPEHQHERGDAEDHHGADKAEARL